MKTITKITTQLKSKRYNIFLDDEFFCGVEEDTLIKLGLKKGMKVSEEELAALVKEERKHKCFNYALYLLNRQNYFEKVLVDKLKTKEYDEEEINFTLEKLRYYNYLDDSRLAQAFVNDKKRFSKKGPRYIKDALRSKGVSSDEINIAIEENYSDEEAYENAIDLLRKKYEYYNRKANDKYQLKGKLYAFLAGRGFSSDIIKKVIDKVMQENEENS